MKSVPTSPEEEPVPLLVRLGGEEAEAKTLDEEPWAPRVLWWFIVLPFPAPVEDASIVEMRSEMVRNLP